MGTWNDLKGRYKRSWEIAAIAIVCAICADYTDSRALAVLAGMMVTLFLQEFFEGWDDAGRKR